MTGGKGSLLRLHTWFPGIIRTTFQGTCSKGSYIGLVAYERTSISRMFFLDPISFYRNWFICLKHCLKNGIIFYIS